MIEIPLRHTSSTASFPYFERDHTPLTLALNNNRQQSLPSAPFPTMNHFRTKLHLVKRSNPFQLPLLKRSACQYSTTATKSATRKQTPISQYSARPSSPLNSHTQPTRSPLRINRRFINWSHFSPRTKAQQKRFKIERTVRAHNKTNVETRMEATRYFVLDEEKELIYANNWLDGQYGVNVLSFHKQSRLPTNYLNDFPDC